MANFNVNFELIGNAGSLVQALSLAASEMQRTGAKVQGASAEIASTMTQLFGQGLIEMTRKATEAAQKISAIRNAQLQENNRVEQALFKGRTKDNKLIDLPQKKLIDQLTSGSFDDIRRRVEEKLGGDVLNLKNLGLSKPAEALKTATREAFAEFRKQGARELRESAEFQTFQYYNQLKKSFRSLFNSPYKVAALGGASAAFKPDDFVTFPTTGEIDKFIRAGQQRILARAQQIAIKRPADFTNENALRARKTQLGNLLNDVVDDLKRAERQLDGLNKGTVQYRFLESLQKYLRQQRGRIQTEIKAVNTELSNFGKGPAFRPLISNADFLASRAGGLAGRGVDAALLNPLGKGLAKLRVDRRELRLILSQIEKDMRDARERIGSGTATRREKTGLEGLIKNLNEQRLQVRNGISGITDELGNVATRTPFSRFVDFFKFGLLAGGFYRVSQSVQNLTRTVIEASAEFQALRTSFVAVLAEPILEADKTIGLTPELFNSLSVASEQLFRNAQVAALRTVATTKEYVTTLQSALAVGQQVGLSQAQVEDLTLSATVAAGAFGIEMEKVGSSLAQIFSGSVRVTNQLARNLGIATAEQREQLKIASQNGRLYEFLAAKLKAFEGVAERVANNFKNVSAAIQDILEFGGSEAVRPLFEFLNEALIRVRDTFISGDATQIFKAPLLNLIETVNNAILELLPPLRDLTDQLGISAQVFGQFLTGTGGVGALTAFTKGLTAILRLVNQILGSGEGETGLSAVGGTLARAIVPLVALRLATGGLVGQVGGLYGGWVKVTEQIQGAFNAAKNLRREGIGAIGSAGLTADPRTRERERVVGFASSITQVNQSNAAVQGATKAVSGLRNAFLNVVQVAGSALGALGQFGIVAAGLSATLSILINIYEEYSGKARESREEQQKFNAALAESQQLLADQIEKAQVLQNILDLQEAVRNQTSTNGIRLAQEARQQVLEFFKLQETLQFEAGNLSQEQANAILERYADIGRSFALLARDSREVAQTSFATLEQAQRRYNTFKTSYDRQVQELTLAGEAGLPGIASLNEALAREKALLDEAERAVRSFGNSLGEGVGDAATKSEENFNTLVDVAKRAATEYGRVAQAAEIATAGPLRAAEVLSAVEEQMQGIRERLDEIRPSLGDPKVTAEYKRLTDELKNLGQVAIAGQTATIASIRLLNKEERDRQVLILKGRRTELQAQIATAKARAIELAQQRDLVDAYYRSAKAQGLLVQTGLSYLKLQLANRAVDRGLEEAEELERLQASVDKLLRDLGEGPKRAAEGVKKATKGRDPLNDFINQLNEEVQTAKDISELIAENIKSINDRRRDILKDLEETGGITTDAFFRASKQTLEQEFNLIRSFTERQIEFIRAQEASARALGLKAQADVDRVEEEVEASKKKVILNPDQRKRDLEAFLKITKLAVDAEKDLLKKRADFEKSLTELVKNNVDRRIEERKRELDQIPQFVKLLTEAEATLNEQLASLNEISPRQLLERNFAARQRARDSERLRLIKEVFPLADPVIRNQALDAVEQFLAEIQRTVEGQPSPFRDLADEVTMLRDKLTKDLPTSLEGAAARLAEIRVSTLTLLEGLSSNNAAGKFAAEFSEVDKLYQELIKKDAAYAKVAEKGGAEANRLAEQRAALFGDITKRQAEILKLSKELSKEDAEQIESRVRLYETLTRTVFFTNEQAAKAQQELNESIRSEIEDQNRHALELRGLSLAELQTKLKLLDVEKSRQDAIAEIAEKQRELGVLTEDQFEVGRQALIDARVQAIELRKAIIEAQLAETFDRIGGIANFDDASPAAQDQAIQAAQALQDLNKELQTLQLESSKLTSSFDNISAGFGKLGEAFEQFQDTTDAFGNTISRAGLRSFGPVFKSLEGLFALFDRNKQREAARTILNAPERFGEILDRQGTRFQRKLTSTADELARQNEQTLKTFSTVLAGSGTDFATKIAGSAEVFVEKSLNAAKAIEKSGEDFRRIIIEDVKPALSGGAKDPFAAGRLAAEQGLEFQKKLKGILDDFEARFGFRPTITGRNTSAHSRLYGRDNAVDLRTRNLTEEHIRALKELAALYRVRILDFSSDDSVSAHNARVRALGRPRDTLASGVHAHINDIPNASPVVQQKALAKYNEILSKQTDAVLITIEQNLQNQIQAVTLPIITQRGGFDKLGTIASDAMSEIGEKTFQSIGDAVNSGAVGGAVAGSSSVKEGFGGLMTTLFDAASQIVSGFASGDAGGIISGIGGGLSTLAQGGLFGDGALANAIPVVGQILGVVGGIFSFIGQRARQNAEKIAKEVEAGIDKLKQAFSEGKISLSEAIQGINQQVASARAKLSGGKTGKKGGKAALAQIEQNAVAAIEEIREQAAEIQREFLESLKLLKQPAELRDIIQQINDARKKAEEFLRSFDDTGDLADATQKAMEFFRLTIKEIRDDIEKTLKDLRKQLKENLEQFERQKRDILTAGRIDPGVSEALSKQRQLIDLEREFREQQAELEDQISAEQKKLDFVNKRAEIEKEIGRIVTQSANALANAADRLASAAGIIQGLPNALRAGGGGGGGPQTYNITVNVGGSNASANEIGVAVATHLRLAGRTAHSRTSQYR